MEKSKDGSESRKKSKEEISLSVTFDEHVKEFEAESENKTGSLVDCKFEPTANLFVMKAASQNVVEKKYYSNPVCTDDAPVKPACFGVKSYLHHFYDAKVDTQVEIPEEYTEQEDDFAYLVDLEKKQRTRGYWFCLSLWVGANLVLIGLIAVLVGLMTPRREEVVAFHDDLKMLDRWAIKFNERLDFCLKMGLLIFGVGNTTVFVTFVLMVCENNCGCLKDISGRDYRTTTSIGVSSSTPPLSPTSQEKHRNRNTHGAHKVPVTEQITSVQPKGENVGIGAADKRFGGRAMQTPYY